MMIPDPPSSRSRGQEARDALALVLRDQAEHAQRREQAPRPPADRAPLWQTVAAAFAAGAVWVAVAPPAAFQPAPVPEPPPALVEAELRMTVVQAVLRIEAFRDSAGSLPTTLLDAFERPEDVEGLTYDRQGPDRFRLSAVRGVTGVLFESGDSIAAWAADARRVMEEVRP